MRVAAAAGLCVCLGCGGDSAPTSMSAGGASSQDDLTSGIEHRLWQVADRFAAGMGGRIENAQAVKSEYAAAVRLTSGAIVSGNRDVWAIQIEGVDKFVCRTCSRPMGARPPRGSFLTLVIDAETFKGTDFGIAPDRVDLGELGTAIELHR